MQDMLFLIVSELVRAYDALELRGEVGEKLEWVSSTQSKKPMS